MFVLTPNSSELTRAQGCANRAVVNAMCVIWCVCSEHCTLYKLLESSKNWGRFSELRKCVCDQDGSLRWWFILDPRIRKHLPFPVVKVKAEMTYVTYYAWGSASFLSREQFWGQSMRVTMQSSRHGRCRDSSLCFLLCFIAHHGWLLYNLNRVRNLGTLTCASNPKKTVEPTNKHIKKAKGTYYLWAEIEGTFNGIIPNLRANKKEIKTHSQKSVP